MNPEKVAKKFTATTNMRLLVVLALSCSSLVFYRQAVAAHWEDGQSPMTEGRAGHTATLITTGTLKGQVIITGGNIGTLGLDAKHPLAFGKQTASVDLYHEDGNVTALPPMYFERLGHTATALDDGSLLVAGGTTSGAASTSEVYDPIKGWSRIQIMREPRNQHTATLLPNGEVLVAGGCNPIADTVTSTAELFNPGFQSWDTAPPMSTARCGHTATRLSNGKILIAGGVSNAQDQQGNPKLLRTTELFDPQTNTWEPGPNMIGSRAKHNAICMDVECSKVLVAGGIAQDSNTANTTPAYQRAEIYDVASNRWSRAADMMSVHGNGMAMARLGNGSIIAMGGQLAATPEVEIYDPIQDRWQEAASHLPAVFQATAVTLTNSKVLFSGGAGDWRYHLPSSALQAVYNGNPGQEP